MNSKTDDFDDNFDSSNHEITQSQESRIVGDSSSGIDFIDIADEDYTRK